VESGLTELWAQWLATRGAAQRAALVDRYMSYTRILAAKCYSRRITQGLAFADYLQFGVVGLLESIDRFDPSLGVKFETFAGHRIQGAIINGAESLSEVQRQVAVRRRVTRERLQSMLAPGAKAAKPRPSALEALAEVAIGLALGFALEDSGMYQADEPNCLPDNAYQRVEMRELAERLGAGVRALPEPQRLVIQRHYFQQLPFDEIAATLGLSKGRVSQLHRSALDQLRLTHSRHEGRVVVV